MQSIPASLQGQALSWFHRLPPNSIDNFRDLSEAFVGQYLCSARHKQNISTLQNIKMRDNESLREFVKRFGQAVLQIEHAKPPDRPKPVDRRQDGPSRPDRPPATPLSVSYEKLLPMIQGLSDFRWPRPLETDPSIRDRSKKCAFHKDHGHTTETCRSLQYLVERLIKAGHLKQYLRSDTGGRDVSQHHNSEAPRAPVAPKAVINYIKGARLTRNTIPGFSRSSTSISHWPYGTQSRGSRKPRTNLIWIQRIINNILRDIILLPVRAGPVTLNVQFSVVQELSPFNIILGRTWLHYMKAIPSTYHQMVSFLTNEGQTDLYGSQLAARQCYQIAREAVANQEDASPPEPSIGARPIAIIGSGGPRIPRRNPEHYRIFLRSNHDIFAWTHSDMKGIHPSIASHKLNVFPAARPIRQKIRRFHPDRQRVIQEEINKLLEAGFIREFSLTADRSNCGFHFGQGMLSFLDAFSGYHQIPMPLVEVYIDDIVVKSKTREQHILHLQEVFYLLRKYDMKLNPSKCAFGVSAGKFLGFMVSQRGIEVSPDQVKAVMETPPPRNKKELQRLTGKLVALGTAVLFRCPSPKEQKPVYYVSRALADVETRYSKMELTALALRSAAQKLRPYFPSSPSDCTDRPALRSILHKPDLTGRMLQWAIELSEFGIEFQPRLSKKGQVMADFVLEYSRRPDQHHESVPNLGNIWSRPSGWDSPASNNEAEYEAILSGLDLALALSVSKLRIYSDSQLVVRHVQKEYEAKDSRMARYLAKNISGQELYPKILNERTKSGCKLPVSPLIGGHLYKRSFTGPYLRCLGHSEGPHCIQEFLFGIEYPEFILHATLSSKQWPGGSHKQNSSQCLEEKAGASQREVGGGTTRRPVGLSTTPGRPTGNTPFALTYGMDAVIPTEIGLPTIRTDAAKQKDADTELGRNLDWADEVRESASIRMADYQQRASAHYNRKVRPRNFKNGTLVLRKVFENTAEVGAGKFQANWEGPYIVSKANENGAYHLQKLDGTPLLRPWNVFNLKQYYQ
ncbi:hypothetical protein CK203_051479 [Vitis vinifera]|uniref:Retrovirus-related Pol polyprotein from transposon 17.6 n=1 Tax=Vitis vinifera TaxID=29760 RepID=A0A438GDE3_VITVI|nr:hypothetical protein CK203_051479 [Vitis vinifera]